MADIMFYISGHIAIGVISKMKCRDINQISFREFKRTYKVNIKPSVIAIDTETEKGKAFLLTPAIV